MEKFKFFVVSDVHGHYTELRKALNNAGFRQNNPLHKLVVVGDSFDRGSESYELYKWFTKLIKKGKAIVLRGNHTQFFEMVLDKKERGFNFQHNGVDKTIDSFIHQTRAFEMFLLFNNLEYNQESFDKFLSYVSDSIQKEFPSIREELRALPDYFETEHYIFTHGIIFVGQDYRNTSKEFWRSENHWAKPEDYSIGFWNMTGKTLVVGHLDTETVKRAISNRTTLSLEQTKPYSTLYVKEFDTYFLDACTILTKKINVLVIEDNMI
mgnify:CR=1 FL=1